MKEKSSLLFFCMIFATMAAYCQYSPKIASIYSNEMANSFAFSPNKQNSFLIPVQIPANFYVTQLGFVCKKEWKFESATKLPLRFRLGTIQYCDWLEGKKGASVSPLNR